MSNSSSHYSPERRHADLHRAVGGTLNLVREVARISHQLSGPETLGAIPAEWMVKRTQFLAYELQALMSNETMEVGGELADRDRLELLNRFFFEIKGFRCLSDPEALNDPSEAYRLDRVLTARAGAPLVLELIYAFLAERIFIDLDFVDLKPACFLRWRCGQGTGRSKYIDISRRGASLSSDELIETLHTRFHLMNVCNASLLETYSFETFLTGYLNVLKGSIDAGHEPEKILFIQDTLISYQPSNLQLVGERALLHRRLGNFKSALADLKRFFAFNDRDKAPPELTRLHDELVRLLEKHRVSPQDPQP